MKELKLEVKRLEERDAKQSIPCDAETCVQYVYWIYACPMCM